MLTIILNAIAVVMLLTCVWFVFDVIMVIRDGRQAKRDFRERKKS